MLSGFNVLRAMAAQKRNELPKDEVMTSSISHNRVLHNARLIRRRVRGMDKSQRRLEYEMLRVGPIGLVLAHVAQIAASLQSEGLEGVQRLAYDPQTWPHCMPVFDYSHHCGKGSK